LIVLSGLDQHIDAVARIDIDLAAGIDELAGRNDAFGLVSDVHDHGVAVHLDHATLNDVAFLQRLGLGQRGLEQGCK
jgi:hypothetical protein